MMKLSTKSFACLAGMLWWSVVFTFEAFTFRTSFFIQQTDTGHSLYIFFYRNNLIITVGLRLWPITLCCVNSFLEYFHCTEKLLSHATEEKNYCVMAMKFVWKCSALLPWIQGIQLSIPWLLKWCMHNAHSQSMVFLFILMPFNNIGHKLWSPFE